MNEYMVMDSNGELNHVFGTEVQVNKDGLVIYSGESVERLFEHDEWEYITKLEDVQNDPTR